MKAKNIFYIGKESLKTVLSTVSYNVFDGTAQQIVDTYGYPFPIDIDSDDMVIIPIPGLIYSNIEVICFSANNNYLGYRVDSYRYSRGKWLIRLIKNTRKVYINFNITDSGQLASKMWFNIGHKIEPHYKELKKKFKKENNQVFFRESLEGKISLFGLDYQIVKNASLEETLYFYAYRDYSVYASAIFNKSDCQFDHAKKNVQLKLSYNDKYSKILDAYENTYDLIKLAPALTPITLTKRCVIQIYIQGEKTLSNYAGGTYWETDVDELIDDEDALTRKYYFAKGPKFIEVDLQNFNYEINAAYRGLLGNNIWNAISKKEVNGQIIKTPCSIKFNKVFDANSFMSEVHTVHLLSTGQGNGTTEVQGFGLKTIYDTYQIEIYTGRDATGTKLYQSRDLYGKDTEFTLAVGDGLYPMVSQSIPAQQPIPSTFNLGEYIVEYQVWGRLLCDVDKILNHEVGHEGEYIDTYDLPRDDFATQRRNYRKCIGLRGFDGPDSVVTIWQNENTSETPTPYGINDFGEYFIPPYTLQSQYFYPLARSSWANISLWVMLGRIGMMYTFENYCAECYKEYSIKDTYHLGDVIKTLLAKIDPSIKHEKTSEYSSFLYGHSGSSASALGECDIYITQKTNILKGEYDQAAQRAEIKFKQLMDMLRDCFRCFWFIDDQNKFRIEHISYFINGLSYNQPTVQLDLTTKNDKFNKKFALYCQQEVEYDKSDLISRYEFKYMDDVTKVMGGDLYIDVNNAYIKKDKTEEINVDNFTADIDYMLFLPDDFSNDGFALLLADNNKKIPIVSQSIKDEKQNNSILEVYVQNWYASFNQLVWHYMEDISGNNIDYNNVNFLYVGHVKRCMKHDIEFPSDGMDINIYGLVKSDIGNGHIEEVITNIDTDMVDIELRYEPD